MKFLRLLATIDSEIVAEVVEPTSSNLGVIKFAILLIVIFSILLKITSKKRGSKSQSKILKIFDDKKIFYGPSELSTERVKSEHIIEIYKMDKYNQKQMWKNPKTLAIEEGEMKNLGRGEGANNALRLPEKIISRKAFSFFVEEGILKLGIEDQENMKLAHDEAWINLNPIKKNDIKLLDDRIGYHTVKKTGRKPYEKVDIISLRDQDVICLPRYIMRVHYPAKIDETVNIFSANR